TMSRDKSVRIWNARTGEPLTPPLPAEIDDAVDRCGFSRDGRQVFADGLLGARVWDAASGRLLHQFPQEQQHIAFSAGGRHVVTWGGHTARTWDARTYQPAGQPLEHTAVVQWASLSPDGGRVAAGVDGEARIFDRATGRPLTAPLVVSAGGGGVWAA